MASNYERLMQLSDDSFDPSGNPDVLDVDEKAIQWIKQIDPACLAEERNDNGPVARVLSFPTTHDLMKRFLMGELSEGELLFQTIPGSDFDAVYLCSALVLPEHRRKGLAERLAMDSLEQFRSRHPIRYIFAWAFSDAGKNLAEKIRELRGCPCIFAHNCERIGVSLPAF